MDYKEFLNQKYLKIEKTGFKPKKLNDLLFDFQEHIVQKALINGKYAIFADTGLGKTIMQLEWANQVTNHTGKPVLILAPLGVTRQTINEGKKFNEQCEYLKGNVSGKGVYITNYEQLDNIDTDQFDGIVLDESSILKNFTGVYRRKLTQKFKYTKYKLCCTATPSPNDINEIGNHSEFLNVLDAPDMRSRWFVRDEGMNNYRLKGHAKKDFYAWVSSWSTLVHNPADLGFVETGKKFILPKLNYIEHRIISEKLDNGKLFNDTAVNATNFNRELKRTIKDRTSRVMDLVGKINDYAIIWISRNDEADYLVKTFINFGYKRGVDFEEVRGSEKPEKKADKLIGFAEGKFRILITKSKIAQFGLNYQHCTNQIHASLDFSFESLYQKIRRSYRFGVKKQVNIHIITLDTMQNVIKAINRKEKQFNELKENLNNNINHKGYGLVMNYVKEEKKKNEYHIIKGDSCVEMKELKDNSMDFSVFSPPFSTLFTYSNSIRDLGNCSDDNEFFKQNEFILKELFRVIKPGRLVAIHTKDLAVYKNQSGYTGLKDFTGDYHRAMEKAGFKYHSKITIWTDPVLEMQRTKTQRLLYKQLRKDSSLSGFGLPEYVTIFKKWEGVSEDDIPVNNKNKDNFDLDRWQRWASPVWGHELNKDDLIELAKSISEKLNYNLEELEKINPKWMLNSWFDVMRTDVLNNKLARAEKDEKHICPLQLTVIRRLIQMYTNPGEMVFSPFMGIGSEGYEAVKLGRKFTGIELKDSYYKKAYENIESATHYQLELF